MALNRARWFGGAEATNPGANAVLATTGQVKEAEEHFVTVVARASVAARMALEHRDAADAANVGRVEFDVAAGGAVLFTVPAEVTISNQRFRVLNLTAIGAGNATASIVLDRRSPWQH